jgi:hypothetical protein
MISSKIISKMGKTRAAKINSIPKNNSAITYLHTLPCKKNAMIALPIEAPAIARGVVKKKELQMKIDIVNASPWYLKLESKGRQQAKRGLRLWICFLPE